MKQYDIKDVAVYLRKSRGEEEDLIKHKSTLVDLCKKNSWRYVLYSEIGTSDSITLRPEMTRLLSDIKDELYDAVVVMDIDRLSRGDSEDQGKIKNTLRKAGTYIITPQRIYDLEDDSDDMMSDFEGLMARYEYKQIKKRFKRGKRAGLKLGKWTTGFAPYPYENSRDKTGLVINPEEYKIFRRAVDMILKEGMRPVNVSVQFNKEGIKTRKGTLWSPSTVYRMVHNPVTLGKIVGNKFYNNHDGTRGRNPKDKWIVIDNCHEPVMTEEEYDAIVRFLKRKGDRNPNMTVRRLSSIVRCGSCGAVMAMMEYKTGESIKACCRTDMYGNRCKNHGGNSEALEDQIIENIRMYSEDLRKANGKKYIEENYQNVLESYRKELSSLSKQLAKIDSLVEQDYYSIDEAKKRKSSVLEKVEEIEGNMRDITEKMSDGEKQKESLRKLDNIDVFLDKLSRREVDKVEANNFYKSMISKVIWTRPSKGADVDVKIIFN